MSFKDPHKCSDWVRDAQTDIEDRNEDLATLMNSQWLDENVKVVRRYNNEKIGGFIYNGWAMWASDNPNAPHRS